METILKLPYGEITFSDSDIVDLSAWIPFGEHNPNNVRPWLLHDHGFTVAVVFASCEQDALDEAVDDGKMDRFLVSPEDLPDYGEDEEGITRLGNTSEPFDIESLGIIELKNPPASFCAQFNARFKKDS